MWTHITVLARQMKTRWDKANHNPDAGYASETVLVTALLIVGALLAIGIIVAKVQSAANDIDLGYVTQSVAR